MKGGKKMKGGLCDTKQLGQHVTIGPNQKGNPSGDIYTYYYGNKNKVNEYQKMRNEYNSWPNENQNIVIKCNDEGYYYEVNIMCDNDVKTYSYLPTTNNNTVSRKKYFFNTFEEAKANATKPEVQIALVKLALLHNCKKKATNS